MVRRAMPPFPVNLAALVAMEAAIIRPANDAGVRSNSERAARVVASELAKIHVKTYASAGNFLLAILGQAVRHSFKKLEERGILLRDRSKDIRPGFVRITIGTSVRNAAAAEGNSKRNGKIPA